MLDFTSSLYLGFRHPSSSLGPWESLTTGAPAALVETENNRAVALALARLQGCERGVLAPSTLHLFWDLFGILSREQVAIYMDAGVYPIARWGVERAAGRGVPVQVFRHHDKNYLCRLLRSQLPGRRPIIVTDGFCPACGRAAPIRDYLACARSCGGLLVIDDTQSLGILGHSPGPAAPYGTGGGGVLRWSGANGPEVLVISSLAKGFGAPIAALSGSSGLVGWFEAESETRVHCSPPSAAVVSAASRALAMNTTIGDSVRQQLAVLVAYFRKLLANTGLQASGGLFPMQTLMPLPGMDAAALHERLLRQGVRTVLHKRQGMRDHLLSFILTAGHTASELEIAVTSMRRAIGMQSRSPTFSPSGCPHSDRTPGRSMGLMR